MDRSDEPTPPWAQGLLRQACCLFMEIDEEGEGVLPVRFWKVMLEELDLEEDSEGAYFLMDFVEAAGKGFFTYEPLMEAARLQHPRAGSGPGSDYPPEQQLQESPAQRPGGGQDDLYQPSGQGDQRREAWGAMETDNSYNSSGPRDSPQRPAPSSSMQRESPPPARDDYGGQQDGDRESVAPELEPIDEIFWQRRGAAIQSLYYQWDCNRLTNAAFQAQMQDLLGEGVDVTNPESEFQKLIAKHQSGRTMKFAALMSALRRDAHNTYARMTGGSLIAGSNYTASEYGAPSECGSDVSSLSHAAGRPSGGTAFAGPRQSGGGRRHYVTNSPNPVVPQGGYGSAEPGRRQPPRAPLSQVPEDQEASVGAFPGEPSRGSRGGMGTQKVPPASDFWSRGAPEPNRGRGSGPSYDRDDAASVAASEAASVADSQRYAFSDRNRTGHGDILTWNDKSRAVTPPKVRESRQLFMDGAAGKPRAYVESGIFNR
eukprot:TRINITY_DN16018_c0_g1_i1.p1 TRINITY_DN16018_c0_g1~~TRINITY_DN16018_c0_g1_i1.p1  ORF type:complete len:485 (+),score=88.58 TRINITY_DN16018_c0_g1_i1:123-1577(+)